MQIKNFKPRLYQETILHNCVKRNCLVILPTGLGKTKTAILIAVHRINSFPNSKVLFLTPTKPLADQICKEFRNSTDLEDSEVVLFTGAVKPEKREDLWKDAKVIVSTPQGCVNDIINGRIGIESVSLLVFDEAHRAVGDYDYCFLAKQYNKKGNYAKIIGLTASPGSDANKILEVCKNLYIEDIEVRTDSDPDVKPYIQELDLDYITLNLSEEFKEIKKFLEDCFKSKLQKMKDSGFIASVDYTTKKDLLNVQKELQRKVHSGEKEFALWQALSLIAEAIKVEHALGLFETQGVTTTYNYLNGLYESAEKTKVKAVKNLVKDLNFKSAFIKVRSLYENKIEHPKLDELKRIVVEELKGSDKKKLIVFNQYRDSALKITEELNSIQGVKAKLFVGQMKKGHTGISQKEQIQIIEDFKTGKYNCLVSTSIGEEGLDIPKVDLVIFYEPVPSAIRTIQRAGRTARTEKGKVIILVTKNTRDEAYRWMAYHKEKRMYASLKVLKDKIGTAFERKQPTLEEFEEKNNLKIFADFREKGSGIVKELVNLGMDVKLQNLAVGDYIVSSRVGIEFKTKEDFVNSIVDKRLLQQIKALKENFEKPLLIIEGEEDIYSVRNVHPNAIQGMLATIAVSYGIPMIFTKNFKETSSLLRSITKREQEFEKKDLGIRVEKKPLTTKEQQEFIIESLPGVGPSLAKSLLKEFKTVKKVINAEHVELQKVEQVGSKKAKEIKRLVDEVYENVD